jgi:hypothetical protein
MLPTSCPRKCHPLVQYSFFPSSPRFNCPVKCSAVF